MTGRKWYEEAKDRTTVEEVAVALGLTVRSKGRIRGFTCPVHNKDHSDGKPSGRIVHGGQGWKCWACDIGGTAVTLACYVLTGQRRPPLEKWHGVREWFAARGWCEPYRPGQRRAAPLEPAARPEPPPEPELHRHAPEEVHALWASAWSPITEPRARRWFEARDWAGAGWEVASTAGLLGLARSLPAGAECPPWAGGERWSWAGDGWSLLLPCYDSDGRMVALRARWTGTELGPGGKGARLVGLADGTADADDPTTYMDVPPPDGWPEGPVWVEEPPPFAGKEVSPTGGGASGCVYADPVARWLLGGRRGPVDPDATGLSWNGAVLIVEGGPAWLRYATEPGRVRRTGDDTGDTHAVIGVWSGAWPKGRIGEAFASRCRVAKRVIYAPDDDAGGDAIARPVVASLASVGVAVQILKGSTSTEAK